MTEPTGHFGLGPSNKGGIENIIRAGQLVDGPCFVLIVVTLVLLALATKCVTVATTIANAPRGSGPPHAAPRNGSSTTEGFGLRPPTGPTCGHMSAPGTYQLAKPRARALRTLTMPSFLSLGDPGAQPKSGGRVSGTVPPLTRTPMGPSGEQLGRPSRRPPAGPSPCGYWAQRGLSRAGARGEIVDFSSRSFERGCGHSLFHVVEPWSNARSEDARLSVRLNNPRQCGRI